MEWDAKKIECLALLARKRIGEYSISTLVQHGLLDEALELMDHGYAAREKRPIDGCCEPVSFYSITGKGREYFDRVLEAANGLLPGR